VSFDTRYVSATCVAEIFHSTNVDPRVFHVWMPLKGTHYVN